MLGHEILHPEFPGDPGVEHLKLVQAVHYPVLPGELLFVHQHGHQGGGEGLGGGADLEDGVFIDLIVPAHLLDPEAFGKDDLIVADDGNGHARDLPVLLSLFGVLLKVGQDLLSCLGVGFWDCSAQAGAENNPPGARKARRARKTRNRMAR